MKWILMGFLLLTPGTAYAKCAEHRSQTVLRHFQRLHPCPSTGRTTGACPGYVKDHIKPLACGGRDAVDNIQWQTIAEGKAKDKIERQMCPPCP